jgi:hypothetical protein
VVLASLGQRLRLRASPRAQLPVSGRMAATATSSSGLSSLRIAGFCDIKVREHPYIDLSNLYESMVSRDAAGIRLNDFGRAFLRSYPNLPASFGDVKAIRSLLSG